MCNSLKIVNIKKRKSVEKRKISKQHMQSASQHKIILYYYLIKYIAANGFIIFVLLTDLLNEY